MSDAEITSPRILVVDDSRIVRATVKKHLAASFDVIEEADGEAGWDKLSADPLVQVVISDLSMPRLDGFGLLSRMRHAADPRIKNTPVIIISGEEDPETKEAALSKGANDFITKSTDRVEMVARVSAAVQLAKTARDLRTTEEVQAKTTTTDVKTGLATRHLLEIEGEKALSLAQRTQTDITLLIFELDDFAPLQARVGNDVADKLMAMMSKLLSAKLRKEETLAHFGTARFGLILPTSVQSGLVLAERLRAVIAAARVNFRGSQISLTASCGAASVFTEATYALAPLLSAAESRLAIARSAGGNRIEAPQITPSKALSIDAALDLLQQGKVDAVRPQLVDLLARLQPLLKLLEDNSPR